MNPLLVALHGCRNRSVTADKVKLSIVIPSHDTRELTLRCLDALGRAALEAEVILVDDASMDGTSEAVAERHPRVIVIRSPESIGFTRAANLGLSRASGDILLLLNSDTETDAGGLQAIRAAFAANPSLGAAGASLHYPDGSPQWSGGRAPSLLWLFGLATGTPALVGRVPFYRRLKPVGGEPGAVEWVPGAALAIRRAAWEQIGPLDESFRFYGQDLDFCLRLRAADWQVALLPDFRVMHHHGATIGSKAGTGGGRQHPELLWTDLLYWSRKHRGPRWSFWAALALLSGGCLRSLARGVATPFVPAPKRRAFREESRALREAIRSFVGTSEQLKES